MADKRKQAVIYVENNKILFYSKELGIPGQINLSSDVISDLEIINQAKLSELINSFFATSNLKNIEYDSILVFAQNSTFDKDLDEGDSKFKYDETQKFLEMVPFEDMISNSYKLGKKTKIVAVNKSLYDKIRINFEQNKAFVVLVVPMAILVETYPNLSTNPDLAFIASKMESIKQFSLTGFGESGLEGEVKNSIGIKKKDRRLYIMLVLMGILFLLLIYMLSTTFFAPKPKVINKLPAKTTFSTPTPTVPVATSSPTLDASSSSEIQ